VENFDTSHKSISVSLQKHRRFRSELTAFYVGVDCLLRRNENAILKERKRDIEEGENVISPHPKTCFRFSSSFCFTNG
jgi:hypothetical protein